jgi:hypothetical protein
VNAFVNAGFGTDKLVMPSSEGSGGENGEGGPRRQLASPARAGLAEGLPGRGLSRLHSQAATHPHARAHQVAIHSITSSVHWIFKNKDHGKTAATASLGLISLWDVEGGLPAIDK